jgi:hypothetical protein
MMTQEMNPEKKLYIVLQLTAFDRDADLTISDLANTRNS